MNRLFSLILLGGVLMIPQIARGFAGTEAAGFLNIPTGGRPVALGGAYSALADDAYAPIANPAGLGFLKTSQFAAMHVPYVESMSYEFASLVHPFSGGRALGASIQNLRTGRTASTDINGNPAGDFSGSFFSYSLAFGQSFGKIYSLGLVGKVIESKIAGFSAHGVAGDVGGMVRPSKKLGVGAVLANMGPKMTFLDEGDPLPSSFRLGGFYTPFQRWVFALQGTHAQTGSNSAQSGIEWNLNEFVSVRGGYNTATVREADSPAGVTAGIGLHLAGQQFDYAWVPMGDLGTTQYFSMVLQWGQPKNNSSEEERPIVFKDKVKKENDDNDIQFMQRDTFPQSQGGGLHP